ncbi:hypothetical protein ACHQM5_030735 [Ranunculus cassubicifolius]
MSATIAKRWRELSGQNHWNGLLKPLDNDMRQYLIHYGDLTQATYDTFIRENSSQYAGGSQFPMNGLLAGAGMQGKNNPLMKYKVTKYIYATTDGQSGGNFMTRSTAPNPWSNNSNWMGYVAVTTDDGKKLMGRRDIVVAWRGTLLPQEWQRDFEANLVPAKNVIKGGGNPMVHQGFLSVYTSSNPGSQYTKKSARDQATGEVHRLIEQYKNEEMSVTVVGHSLGAALATLCAGDIVSNGIAGPKLEWAKRGIVVTAFPYASPRVGNREYRQALDNLGVGSNSPAQTENEDGMGSVLAAAKGGGKLRILRIVNQPDPIPTTPPTLANYTHVGQLFEINSTSSPYMPGIQGTGVAHDLEVYIHGIQQSRGSIVAETDAGPRRPGSPGPFQVYTPRDFSLVNKHVDGLKPEYLVAPNWWVGQNKGMTQQPDGKWVNSAGSWIMHERPSDEDENEREE